VILRPADPRIRGRAVDPAVAPRPDGRPPSSPLPSSPLSLTLRRARSALGWATAALASLGLAALSAGRPSPAAAPPAPAPRPRPLLAAEQAALVADQQAFAQALDAARARLGRWPRVAELEGAGPDGAPLLPHGVPDNPAAEAVGWVIEGCGALTGGEPPADWRWCPSDGTLQALGAAKP